MTRTLGAMAVLCLVAILVAIARRPKSVEPDADSQPDPTPWAYMDRIQAIHDRAALAAIANHPICDEGCWRDMAREAIRLDDTHGSPTFSD